MFASGVMLVAVAGILVVVLRSRNEKGPLEVNPRHIQFASVCLIVPTILILGLEKVLTSETTATLIGGLAGYLLSNLGKYEPSKPDPGHGGTGNTANFGASARTSNDDTEIVDDAETSHQLTTDEKTARMKARYPPQDPFKQSDKP